MAEEPKTVIVERSGHGGMTALVAIIALLIVAAIGYMLVQSQDEKNSAVSTAAEQVGDAAQDVGEAARDAAGGE